MVDALGPDSIVENELVTLEEGKYAQLVHLKLIW
jgi:hypothetical protein